jgi:dihydropteroate synthase
MLKLFLRPNNLLARVHSCDFMTNCEAHIISIDTLEDAKNEIKQIGSDPHSIDIMAPKMITKVIRLTNVKLQDAIIVKQDMLSIGGEVAVPKDTFDLHDTNADILIIGTIQQHRQLIEKLNRHYPRIQRISACLLDVLEDVR